MLQTRLDLGVDSNIYNVGDLRKPKISHLTSMGDLANEDQTHLCMTFRISGCKHHTDMIFVPWDIENVKIIYVSQTFDLGTQDHTHFSYDLDIFGCVHAIDSILVSILTFSMPRISKNPSSVTWSWRLTLIVKVKPIFLKFILFSRSAIIATLFFSDLLSSSTLIMLKSILKSSP